MFYAKGVNCCAEVQFLLGSLAEGVLGNCGDLPAAFADTPVPPYFPDGLREYVCHAFPDDDRPVDSLIVALISMASACPRALQRAATCAPRAPALTLPLAVALPVTLFLQSAFEIANDNEAPEARAGIACAQLAPA